MFCQVAEKHKASFANYFSKTTFVLSNSGFLDVLFLVVHFSLKYFFKINFETYFKRALALIPGIISSTIAHGQILKVFLAWF